MSNSFSKHISNPNITTNIITALNGSLASMDTITANDNINVANEDIVTGLDDEVGNTTTNMSPQWEV